MSPENVARLVKMLDKADFQSALDDMIAIGDVPYRLNRSAVRAIDVQEDVAKGRKILKNMLSGLDAWIAELERFADESGKMVKRVNEALHRA